MKNNVCAFFLMLISSLGFAQGADSLKKVIYTPDFKFRDGIYLNIEQVKKNSPIGRARIATALDIEDKNFYAKLFDSKSISLYDEQGMQRDLSKKNIWGFSENGVLFINYNDDFAHIPVIGSICHFVSDKIAYTNGARMTDPFMNPYSGYYRQTPVATTEQVQYILDFETGQVAEFENLGVQAFLMRDKELLEEFTKLSRKKQQQLKFLYIRKFNDKHPLYLYTPVD